MSVTRTLSGRRLVKKGRPTKHNEKTVNLILAAIRAGKSRREAARAGGIAKSTLMAWLAKGCRSGSGYAAFYASVLSAETDWACRRTVPTLEERWAARKRDETPTWARLTTDPDVRARRLARKRTGRPTVERNSPESPDYFRPDPANSNRDKFRPRSPDLTAMEVTEFGPSAIFRTVGNGARELLDGRLSEGRVGIGPETRPDWTSSSVLQVDDQPALEWYL